MTHGYDFSHWQGTKMDWAKLRKDGASFVYLKASQGTAYKDACFRKNYANARLAGFKVGAYHFVDTSDAAKQYANFITAVGDLIFDLPPALDCEYYNPQTLQPVAELRRNRPPLTAVALTAFGVYAITTAAIVDSIGRSLTAWMTGRENMDAFGFPAIYTNQYSGNTIFTSPKWDAMKRYPLWVANWNVKKPNLPYVWRDEPWYMWQTGLTDGQQYGIVGQMDCDTWGDLFPFPGTEPEPTPTPEPETAETTITLASGITIKVTLTEVK